jgi:hypothetical protein
MVAQIPGYWTFFLTYKLHPKIREMGSVLLHLINENIASMNLGNDDLSSLNN